MVGFGSWCPANRATLRIAAALVSGTTLLGAGTAQAQAPGIVSTGPVLSGFSPTHAPVGVLIRITGSRLGYTRAVTFSGTAATFTIVSSKELTAVVPSGAASGPITVVTRGGSSTTMASMTVTPIEHVVLIFQENHSFDNVLGLLCVETGRCDGVDTGELATGQTIPLSAAPDVVPNVGHSTPSQITAMNGGAMNGFSMIQGCTAAQNYACYSQYTQSEIPNLWALASRFALSDRTFEPSTIPSWGAHLELGAMTLDGFTGSPLPTRVSNVPKGYGWGCDSNRAALWAAPGGTVQNEPSCVPDYQLDPAQYPYGGAFEATPVQWVPTVMDAMQQAGVSWRIYSGAKPTSGGKAQYDNYIFDICTYFADCLYTAQANNQYPSSQVVADATSGDLPEMSMVFPTKGPTGATSQHNGTSMLEGDNWIGQVVSAIENGPDWDSTAIFITYDDCGCFYDHVPPPPGYGIRVPMVIVSPWAKPGYTDSNTASFASVIAFAEHTFNFGPVTSEDADAYDYANAFDYSQTPLSPVRMTAHPLPLREREWLRAHPPAPDTT